jgi:hypothetical protein
MKKMPLLHHLKKGTLQVSAACLESQLQMTSWAIGDLLTKVICHLEKPLFLVQKNKILLLNRSAQEIAIITQ